ncbi:molybdopterin-dependent oxidoreductase [Microvirga sp. 2MCAF38]
MIERLGVRILRTSTNWTDGVKTFEGVSMRDLMTFVGARGSSVIASALNDSAVEIPISDFEQYDVLLAFRMDGRDLRVRDKGPLWIVYPRDQEEALRNPQYDSRWIGQLKILTVQ